MNLHQLLRATTNSHASGPGWPHRITVLESERATYVLFGKPAQAIVLTICLTLMPLLIPPLGRFLSFRGQPYQAILPDPHGLISFRARTAPSNVIGTSDVDTFDAATGRASNPTDECAAQLIDDPAHALDQFYSALARTDAKEAGAITRITHYGDSPITNDGITGTARRLLQERFGDAGHGFILVDRPWAWYGHQAITFSSSGSWGDDSLMNPMTKDGSFGLGGVTFHATAGRSARFAPAEDGDTGKNFSRLDVYYLQQPGGGEFNKQRLGEIGLLSSQSCEGRRECFRTENSFR
jgi:hypothetical protein